MLLPVPIGCIRSDIPPFPASIIGPVPKPIPLVPFGPRSNRPDDSQTIVLTSATEVLHKAISVPIGPPRLPLAVIRATKVVLKTNALEAPQLKTAVYKPAPPKSIPANIPDHQRTDLSTVVIEPYEPDADEQHIKDIRDEFLQDEHPSHWYMKVFSKLLSTILRQEQKNMSKLLNEIIFFSK